MEATVLGISESPGCRWGTLLEGMVTVDRTMGTVMGMATGTAMMEMETAMVDTISMVTLRKLLESSRLLVISAEVSYTCGR